MSNVLHPLAYRYSLFFTVAMFDSSRVCQSRHPTKTVQDMVLEAQERYERLDRKQARHKLRALLRNVSMASASSNSTGTSSSTHRTTRTVDSESTELTCYTFSSSCFDTTVNAPLPVQSSVDPSFVMPSFPSTLAPVNADASAVSSMSQCDTAHTDSDNNPTSETTPATVSSSSDNCIQQHRPLVSAVTHSSSLSSASSHKLARAIKRKAKQLQHTSRSSIATLLSIALTTLFLSMLQRRRHRLTVLSRKGVLLVRTSSRQAQQSSRREMKSRNSAQQQQQQHQHQHHEQHAQDRHDPQLRQLSHHRCEVSPRQDHPGRLRLYRRGTLVSSASSSSFFSLSSPPSAAPAPLPPSPSLHQILPSSFNMIAAASATSSSSSTPHHTPSNKEAYVSAWLQHQNLHDRAAWQDHHSNRAEPNHSNYPHSSVYNPPPTHSHHRRSISLMGASEFEDEIRQSPSEIHSKQQQQQQQHPHPPPSSHKQKRHSSALTHGNSKGHACSLLYLSSPAAAHMVSTHAMTTATTASTASKSKKHRRHTSMHEPYSRSPEELAWDFHYYYQRQQREEQVYLEEQRRLARLRGTASLALTWTSGTAAPAPVHGLYRHASHPVESSRITSLSFSTESPEAAVARAKSLNRLAAPALLSRETSKALGICRSDTLSTNGKKKNQERDPPSNSRSGSPLPPLLPPPSSSSLQLSLSLSLSRDRSRTMNSWDQPRGAPSTPPTSGLKHKKTLKEHLTPSFRSFASRFGSVSGCHGGGGHGSSNGHSSRPCSFAGSKGDLLSFDNSSSRSATPTPGSNRHSISGGGGSGHLLDFKPLKAGPETVEHLRRCSLEQQQQRPASTDGSGAALERRLTAKLTHRRGVSLTCAESPFERDGPVFDRGSGSGHGNGHGYNHDDHDDDEEEEEEDEDEQETLRDATEEDMFSFEDPSPPLPSPPPPASNSSSGNDSMKKQILTLLSIRRKSKSSLKSNSTSTTMMAASPACLSPLELEAQEDLPWDENDYDDDDDEDEEDEDEDEDEVDMYIHHQEVTHPFDFMLVPKDQYEFQPLVV